MSPRASRRMRVLVLMHEDLVPPESMDELSPEELELVKTEYDVTSTLRDLGHDVTPLGVATDLGVLRDALNGFRPRITFNLLEEFHGLGVYDQHVVSYLELMKRRYTGCNPRGLMLARDKALSKQIMAYHRIPVPEFAVLPMNRRFRAPKRLSFPVIVKSLTAEGSEGISQASICTDAAQMEERTAFVHRKLGTDAIAERFVEGRELYVGVMGNRRLETFPVWELRFGEGDDAPRIATTKVKWDEAYQKRHQISWGRAELPDELAAKLARTCKRVFKVLNLSGYARIDIRLAEDGRFYVLEANPNPDLSFGGEFADSAEAAGLSYEKLLGRIVRTGLNYRTHWEA